GGWPATVAGAWRRRGGRYRGGLRLTSLEARQENSIGQRRTDAVHDLRPRDVGAEQLLHLCLQCGYVVRLGLDRRELRDLRLHACCLCHRVRLLRFLGGHALTCEHRETAEKDDDGADRGRNLRVQLEVRLRDAAATALRLRAGQEIDDRADTRAAEC